MSIFTFNIGTRIGESYWSATNYTLALASLKIGDDYLEIATPFKKYTLTRHQLKRITPFKGTFGGRGFRLDHQSNEVPPFVVIWTQSSPKVEEALKTAGYTVDVSCDDQARAFTNEKRFGLSFVMYLLPFILFVAIYIHERYIMKRNMADTVLNAVGLTGFITLVLLFWYKRLQK